MGVSPLKWKKKGVSTGKRNGDTQQKKKWALEYSRNQNNGLKTGVQKTGELTQNSSGLRRGRQKIDRKKHNFTKKGTLHGLFRKS